jgi:[histone H3]-lysine36 N-dimethyltransferase SETMAR
MDVRYLRAIFFYEFKLGRSASEAADNINRGLGPGTTSHATVSRWYKRFEAGDTYFDDRPHTSRPNELDNSALERELQLHPSSTTCELTEALSCSNMTVDRHLHDLDYGKVLATWTPHKLSDGNRAARLSICQSLLSRPHRKDFLADIITGDESWVHYENDTRRAYWLPRGEDPPAQPKPDQSDQHCKKVLLCAFWDSRGMLYYELLSGNETVNADVYAAQLRKLAAAVREKRPRRANVYLLHDNARPHIALKTHQQLESLGWETLPHPPYSPDIAPSDYHLFQALKNVLRGKRFANFGEVESELTSFFNSQKPEFWVKGIQSLPDRWQQVIDADGQYIVD